MNELLGQLESETGRLGSALKSWEQKRKAKHEGRDARRMAKSAERIKANLYKTDQSELETTDGKGSKFTATVHPTHAAWGEDVSAKMELPPGRWSRKTVAVEMGWDYYTHRMTDMSVTCQTLVGEDVTESASFRICDGVVDPESTLGSAEARGYLYGLDVAIRQELVAKYHRENLFDVRFE